MGLNIGDIIFQLFVILVPIIFIISILLFVRSLKKRNEQLKRIENKVDKIVEQKSQKLN